MPGFPLTGMPLPRCPQRRTLPPWRNPCSQPQLAPSRRLAVKRPPAATTDLKDGHTGSTYSPAAVRWRLFRRNRKAKRCSVSQFGLDPDFTAKPFNDPLADRETHTSSGDFVPVETRKQAKNASMILRGRSRLHCRELLSPSHFRTVLL